MMGEFLLLMVFLDKFWFGPVGKVLDERDQSLRGKLALVKDNGSEVGANADADERGRCTRCLPARPGRAGGCW